MRVVFIIGTGRCGSTMVHEVLARHPEAGFISNLDANLPFASRGRWNSAIYERMPASAAQRDVRRRRSLRALRFGPSEPYRLLGREVSFMLAESFRDLTAEDATPWLEERLRAFFERRASAQGKDLFLCKLSGWPRARLLHRVLPEAKFLHVVRDGRAVADSLMRRPWWRGYRGPWHWQYGPLPPAYEQEWQREGRSFVALAALQWKIAIDAFIACEDAIPADRWLQIRYEDFVADARAATEKVLEFADLRWTKDFEDLFGRYCFSTQAVSSYRTNLTPEQLGITGRILGDLLRRLGYEVEVAPDTR